MQIEIDSDTKQTESRIALVMNAVLTIVLAASLIAGGRQMASASPSYRAPNVIAVP